MALSAGDKLGLYEILSPIHLVLIVLPEHMACKMATAPRQFGLAVLNRGGGSPNLCYVFLHRAVDSAKDELVPGIGILGHLIAHEFCHLLPCTNSHFPVGVMRATWRSTEIKQALTGNLRFTPEQVEAIRADVQRRLGAEVISWAIIAPSTAERSTKLPFSSSKAR